MLILSLIATNRRREIPHTRLIWYNLRVKMINLSEIFVHFDMRWTSMLIPSMILTRTHYKEYNFFFSFFLAFNNLKRTNTLTNYISLLCRFLLKNFYNIIYILLVYPKYMDKLVHLREVIVTRASFKPFIQNHNIMWTKSP